MKRLFNRDEPRICPPGCPYLNGNSSFWGCDDCLLAEDAANVKQADAEAAYDKKAQEDWNEN
jgi:hypothetical protein